MALHPKLAQQFNNLIYLCGNESIYNKLSFVASAVALLPSILPRQQCRSRYHNMLNLKIYGCNYKCVRNSCCACRPGKLLRANCEGMCGKRNELACNYMMKQSNALFC